ncbi:small GTP-binding protein domain [Allomyces macrogynus ATCC 38327]|uniref:Small GTP-binding protein domain n=1 Tax=Allomyces macrogynus (strain ATCC 38327) TaxID=578462 RepID=A0A0L0SEJ6_ALLM3|nr:small GTP-binding protein domain [Allomyces macrogynus ATCC 38327]|eukprot:KNE60906.1 small GTP-binding protein domain [Allomyces macrogynus ATCC 38327]
MSAAIDKATPSIKLILIGDSGTGKSSLLVAYTEQRFVGPDEAVATVGVDFRLVKKVIDGKATKAYIWDTAGQERFRTLTSSFYRGASVVFVVFDVTERESFENLDSWFTEVRQYCGKNGVLTCIVANKCDMAERVVTTDEAIEYAKAHDAEYREVSAKTMDGVKDLFDSFAEQVARHPNLPKSGSTDSVNIGDKSSATAAPPSSSSCAC